MKILNNELIFPSIEQEKSLFEPTIFEIAYNNIWVTVQKCLCLVSGSPPYDFAGNIYMH